MSSTDFKEKYEYIDDEPITGGAYGQIYRIKDKKVKTEYVLKKLRKEDPNEPNIKGTDKLTFENEKNFLINVKGTNILNIIDYYFDDEKNYCLILEKMDGNLDDMLKIYKNGMPSKLIRKIFSQINSGLKIMIKNDKTHRDLKPSNILYSFINNNETDFIIKIGDFGLAKNLVSTKTVTNQGTDLFKAPEIETGKSSNKCDLYSIGIILYILKTGEYIFGKTWDEIKKNKKENNIKKYTDDEKLNDLIKKLVVIDPHKRMEWKDYFDHPFFKVNDEDVKESEECKIKN